MKNIQIIDGASNCTYSLFSATDEEFASIFPQGTDVAFADELSKRGGRALQQVWARPIDKKKAKGIQGTLFFDLEDRKALYPTRKDHEMTGAPSSPTQRKTFGIP